MGTPSAGPPRSAPRTRTVSVIIPAYNSGDSIGACLRSLFNQTLSPHEVIVINDASTDTTAQMAGSFDVKIFSLTKNKGSAFARSHGAGKATGDIVAFLDSDCVAPPTWVESIVKEFEADPSLGGVGGCYAHPRKKSATALMAKLEEEYAHHIFSLAPFESNPPGGNSAFLRDVWLKKRSGCEVYLFRGINSGEDDFACNEIKKTTRVKFSDALKVSHQPRTTEGYFKRHVRRGQSWALQRSKHMSSGTPGSVQAYGGYELFFASTALGLALISLLTAPFVPLVLAAVPFFLILFFFLARRFSRFIENANRDLPPGEKITGVEKIKVFILVPVRSACWVGGASLFYLTQGILGIRKQWNILLSILHFWMPGRISKLFYFVTSVCNARCEFCFNLENVENGSARKVFELSLAEIEKITDRLKRLPYLCLSGGEPFLRQDLADVIEAFHQRCKTQWVTIPTNASLTKLTLETTQEILTRCPTLFLTVQISLDGMHEAHDRSRKIRGGFDAMVKTLEGLSSLRRWYPNLRVQIATCYDDFNKDQVPAMVRFCRDHFEYDQQMFYLIRDTGKLITQSKNHLIPSFFETLAENENYEWGEHRRTLWHRAVRALQSVTYSDVVKIKRRKEFIRPCRATRKFVTLYDDGQISPCEVLDSVHLGNIRDFDYDYYRLVKTKTPTDFYKDEIVKNKCNCDWMCAIPINMLYDPKMIPRLTKALIKPGDIGSAPEGAGE